MARKVGKKIAIIGAGFVGATTAFSICKSGLATEVVLIDVNKEKAEGEALDINHGLYFLGQMKVYAGDYADVADSDIIIITAGANRKPGETRLELAKKNAGIMRSIIPEIMKYYNGGILLVVSNPVDVLTYLVWKETGLPKCKIIGSGTVLDSSRFRYALSEKLDVDVKNVHAFITGEHGDSAVPLWSTANIAGVMVDDFIAANNKDLKLNKEEIYEDVQQSGATVIKAKGATYYAIALSVTRICEAILSDRSSVLTVGSVIEDHLGMDDVVLSLPCIVSGDGIERVLNISIDEDEKAKLQASATKIRSTIDEVL